MPDDDETVTERTPIGPAPVTPGRSVEQWALDANESLNDLEIRMASMDRKFLITSAGVLILGAVTLMQGRVMVKVLKTLSDIGTALSALQQEVSRDVRDLMEVPEQARRMTEEAVGHPVGRHLKLASDEPPRNKEGRIDESLVVPEGSESVLAANDPGAREVSESTRRLIESEASGELLREPPPE